ncbi:PASTA domain-containing protein [Flagellimonas taeanensis]|uniref:penicillin-binding protein n=1 Tax=Flavobacteriaceae TaxID=49546 RepID=UPI000E6A76C0|nr:MULTISPECIES: penicillin-binding protein [Allomuricauda]MDC6384280.1 penicillin-binding protein [Muricauda sp. SK9]RIV49637.1 PASTA domain-containing protein [Allomuricauda taeanensis]RIV53836.1 PASTA domain-containing protein [Allomuricauda taeanensis]
MAITEKNIMNRLYLVAGGLLVMAIAVVVKLVDIQMVEGEKYKELALSKTEKMFTIEPNRGNLYSEDGSLLAASVPKYEIRFDAQTVSETNFQNHVAALSDSLGILFNRPSSYYRQLFRKARANGSRYELVARNVDYLSYVRIKQFPLFNLGPYKGGFIETHRVVREYPLGNMAARSIGYEKVDENGYYTRVGLDGAFGETYLRGREGKRLKQKIAKGQWKPVGLDNIVEPQDGLDVVSTIDVNIQDIAHHELLAQLEKYKADHGCVVVMETKTGEVKAISNLGRTSDGKYYEKLNYAIGESHEPGSTFKLMSLVAALEDKVVDTSTVIDTEKGRYRIYDGVVKDSKWGGYGKISTARAFAVSSNTAFAKIINENYKDQPAKFVNRLMNMGLHKKLDLPIIGEGDPVIRYPGDKGWSGISLGWMSHGYEVSLTPMQTLAFYNAIANDGELVKPRLIKEVREGSKVVKRFDKEVLNPSICSKETVDKVRQLMKDVVEKKYGTGHGLYSKNFSMAGKTGTAQKNYVEKDPDKLAYISSFVGYFPADNPKYSCIVIIHEPDKSEGYYGADVSGPVFKSMAQKIHAISPLVDEVETKEYDDPDLDKAYEQYYAMAQKKFGIVPNVKGMSGMDAVSLLENLGLEVEVHGNGKVKKQSIDQGTDIKKVKKIVLELS